MPRAARNTGQPATLREGLDTAVKKAPHVDSEGMDAGLVAAARALADQIDAAVQGGNDGTLANDQVTKAMYLIPHYSNLCKEMLLTPASRKAAKMDEPGTAKKSKLQVLRDGAA